MVNLFETLLAHSQLSMSLKYFFGVSDLTPRYHLTTSRGKATLVVQFLVSGTLDLMDLWPAFLLAFTYFQCKKGTTIEGDGCA